MVDTYLPTYLVDVDTQGGSGICIETLEIISPRNVLPTHTFVLST